VVLSDENPGRFSQVLNDSQRVMHLNMRERKRKPTYLPSFCWSGNSGKFFAVMLFLYFAAGVLTTNLGYIDFGDGNYLYISWRMAEGAVLYEDVVSPQPPMHLLVGSILIRLGQALGGGFTTLVIVRLFSILLRMATAWFVALIADRLFEDDWTACLAGSLFLFLPIGFFWSKGYQSEPLLIFFLTSAFWALLYLRPGHLVYAGVASVLALFTNMTAVPYIGLFVVYVLSRDYRKNGLSTYYLVTLVAGSLGMLGIFHLYSNGAYIENVFFNQVGTFHRTHPVLYALEKIINQGGNILIAEGGIVLCAALGAVVYLCQQSLPVRQGAVWYFFWGLGSLVFVSKGGTEDYIFSIGEPMVAVFAAFFLRFLYLGTFSTWMTEKGKTSLGQRLTRAAALLTLGLVLFIRPAWEIYDTLVQGKYELPSWQVRRVMEYVDRFAEPEQPLFAPPYYAFIARRPIPEDASSTFIWYMRYFNHRRFGDPDPEVMPFIHSIVDQLDGQQVPVVLLNVRQGQLGAVPEIRQAVEENYTRIPDANIRPRNENLQIFVSRQKIPLLNLRDTP
jgi:hypothetical protein